MLEMIDGSGGWHCAPVGKSATKNNQHLTWVPVQAPAVPLLIQLLVNGLGKSVG